MSTFCEVLCQPRQCHHQHHFPSGTTVEECGELEMIWMLETGVDDDMMEMITRSSNVIVTVKEAPTREALILS